MRLLLSKNTAAHVLNGFLGQGELLRDETRSTGVEIPDAKARRMRAWCSFVQGEKSSLTWSRALCVWSPHSRSIWERLSAGIRSVSADDSTPREQLRRTHPSKGEGGEDAQFELARDEQVLHAACFVPAV